MALPLIPDPELMSRLEQSVRGIDWAASLVAPWQHESVEGEWTPNAQVWHLLAVERENFQPRIHRILTEERPELARWDSDSRMAEHNGSTDIEELAGHFVEERAKTVGLLTGLSAEQWQRTGLWPDGQEVDLGWIATKVLWHGLDHLALLLDYHQEFERKTAQAWAALAPGV
jgi:hypothetical protein